MENCREFAGVLWLFGFETFNDLHRWKFLSAIDVKLPFLSMLLSYNVTCCYCYVKNTSMLVTVNSDLMLPCLNTLEVGGGTA
jgi:hypothetical protein